MLVFGGVVIFLQETNRIFWINQTWCKCRVILSEFPYTIVHFGLVINDHLFLGIAFFSRIFREDGWNTVLFFSFSRFSRDDRYLGIFFSAEGPMIMMMMVMMMVMMMTMPMTMMMTALVWVGNTFQKWWTKIISPIFSLSQTIPPHFRNLRKNSPGLTLPIGSIYGI